MLKFIQCIKIKKEEYLQFVLHSSELMPGGSPNFKNENDIAKLYTNLDSIFNMVSKSFTGCTLKEYYNYKKENKKK